VSPWKGSKLVGSPLSSATMSAGPDTLWAQLIVGAWYQVPGIDNAHRDEAKVAAVGEELTAVVRQREARPLCISTAVVRQREARPYAFPLRSCASARPAAGPTLRRVALAQRLPSLETACFPTRSGACLLHPARAVCP
jgi:hypothetical protein